MLVFHLIFIEFRFLVDLEAGLEKDGEGKVFSGNIFFCDRAEKMMIV